jgi:hypothetical protein
VDALASLPGRGLHELAFRVSGGTEIRLYWDPDQNRTHVEIWQPDYGDLQLLEIPGERALEAFYQPLRRAAAAARRAGRG